MLQITLFVTPRSLKRGMLALRSTFMFVENAGEWAAVFFSQVRIARTIAGKWCWHQIFKCINCWTLLAFVQTVDVRIVEVLVLNIDISELLHQISSIFRQTVETPMGRSCSQTSRQQVDHQSNILGSTEMVKTTGKTENKMERWPQSAPGNHLDKIGPRQTSVEAIQGGVPP